MIPKHIKRALSIRVSRGGGRGERGERGEEGEDGGDVVEVEGECKRKAE